MLAWLSANWVTIVVLCVLCLIVFGIIRGMIRDKKRGKSVICAAGGPCSGDCAHCQAAHAEAVRAARAAKAKSGK